MKTISTPVRIALAVLLAILTTSVALLYPYGTDIWPPIAFSLVIANAITAIWVLGWPRGGIRPHAILSRLVIAALAIPPYFIVTTRQHNDELVSTHFDGTITRLYRSSNHNYPAIEIDDPTNGRLTLEPVPEKTWNALSTGDRVQKEVLSTYIMHGTECLPIVEPSSLHAIRGARIPYR